MKVPQVLTEVKAGTRGLNGEVGMPSAGLLLVLLVAITRTVEDEEPGSRIGVVPYTPRLKAGAVAFNIVSEKQEFLLEPLYQRCLLDIQARLGKWTVG